MKTDWKAKTVSINGTLPDHVIVFDNICRLCAGWVRFVIKYDRDEKFYFVSAQSELGQELLDASGLETLEFNSNLYLEKSVAYYKMDTVIYILSAIGGIWSMIKILHIIPRPVRNWLYDRIALNRYKLFGRLETCLIPTASVRKRFLDN